MASKTLLSPFHFRRSQKAFQTNPQTSKSPISLSLLSARYRSNRDQKRMEAAAEKPLTSAVWTFFKRNNANSTDEGAKAECLCCKAKGKATLLSQSRTGKLWTHLEDKHPVEFLSVYALKQNVVRTNIHSKFVVNWVNLVGNFTPIYHSETLLLLGDV